MNTQDFVTMLRLIRCIDVGESRAKSTAEITASLHVKESEVEELIDMFPVGPDERTSPNRVQHWLRDLLSCSASFGYVLNSKRGEGKTLLYWWTDRAVRKAAKDLLTALHQRVT